MISDRDIKNNNYSLKDEWDLQRMLADEFSKAGISLFEEVKRVRREKPELTHRQALFYLFDRI